MSKFMYLYTGAWEEQGKDTMDAWMKWFGTLGDKLVDGGNPFVAGREVTAKGTKSLPLDRNAIAGYSIVKAADIDEAEKLLKGCPMVTSVRVYEAKPM